MEINKRTKKCIALMLVFAILFSNIMQSVSYATTLTSDSNTPVYMMVTDYMPGGACSGQLTPAQQSLYDTTGYAYTVGVNYMYKIYETEDYGTYSNQLYCLSAWKSLPGVTGEAIEYENNGLIENVNDLQLSGYSKGTDEYTSYYNSIKWLINNMYNEKTDSATRHQFFERAFEGYTDYDLDVVEALLTDDDIEIVQQYALWYFTNNDTGYDYSELPTISIYDEATGMEGSYGDIVGDNTRQDLANYLYQYLVSAAASCTSDPNTFPEFDTTATMEGYTTSSDYIAGPMMINEGDGTYSNLGLEVTNQEGAPILNYKIFVNSFEVTDLNDIIGNEFSIYIPKTGDPITSVNVKLKYTKNTDELLIWRPTDTSAWDENQELGLIVPATERYSTSRDFTFPQAATGSYTLQVEKVDEADGSPVAGVSFEIDIDGTVHNEVTTSTGTISINVPLEEEGTSVIKVKETGAPNNYLYNNNQLVITATIVEDNGEYVVSTITSNDLEGLTATLDSTNNRIRVYAEDTRITGYTDLILTKVGEGTNTPLPGVAFDVNGTEYVTGDGGMLTVSNIDISNGNGTITITEKEAPEGYKKASPIVLEYTSEIVDNAFVLTNIQKLSGTNCTVSIDTNKDIAVTLTDELIKGNFNVVAQKVDKDSSAPLENATLYIGDYFSLTSTDGKISKEIPFTTSDYETVIIGEAGAPTNYNGTTDVLTLRVYKKVVNDTYVIDRVEKVSGDGTITYSVNTTNNTITAVVPNERATGGYTINLLKKDSSNNNPLSGVVFSINGQEKTTEDDGRIIIPVGITSEGEDVITISEVSPKDGYKALTGTLKITATKVLENGSYKVSQIVLDNSSTMTAVLDQNTGTINIEANNEKITGSYTINLNKVGRNGGTNTPLKNAVFEINGEEYTTTDEGTITIPNIAITSTGTETITIREVSAPEGYNKIDGTLILTLVKDVLNEEYIISTMAQAVSIDGYTAELTNNKTITINATDEKTTGTYTVKVLKQSSTTTSPLANAVVSINGEELLTGTSGEVEKVINTQVGTPDTVTVSEVSPPPGYVKTNDVLTLSVTKKVQNGQYVIDTVSKTSGDGTITYTVDNTTNTINVVIPNDITLGEYTINLHKQDSSDASSIQGVIFNIDGQEYTTNDSGNIIVSKPVSSEGTDVIEISEASPKDGYKALPGTLKVTVTKTLVDNEYKITNMVLDNTSSMTANLDSTNNAINIVAENEKITGNYTININKLSNLGGSLSEASFEVNGTTYNVDSNGNLSIPNIDITSPGTETITIKEVDAPYGYNKIEGTLELTITKGVVNEEYVITDMAVSNPVTGYTATLTDNKTITVDATDERITGSYQVKVVKENLDGSKKLEGATVTVNGVEYITNDQGVATVPAVNILDTGVDSITVQETGAPYGYIQTFGIYRVNATKSISNRQYVVSNIEEISPVDGFTSTLENNVITVTIKDEQKDGNYNIRLVKQDVDDGSTIKDVVFTINGTDYTTLDGGLINIPGVFANEDTITVSVTEKTPARLYKKLNGTLTFDIEVEQTATRFAIKNVNDSSVPDGYEVTFDSDTNLVTITAKDKKIEGSYGIVLEKVDSEDGTKKLQNVVFEINGTEYTTNGDGIISIPNIAISDVGTDEITIVEKETINGYKTTIGTFKLNVNKIIQNETFIPESIEVTNAVTGYSATLDSTTNMINILATNERSSGSYLINLQKVKEGTTEPIAGVRFTINGTEYITNDEGRITKSIKITEPGTDTVTIKEESAPTGYKALKDTLQIDVTKVLENEAYYATGISNVATAGYTVDFDDDNQTITILAEDELITGSYNIDFTKVDEQGAGLKDAVFTIDGVDYTSGDDGKLSIPVRNITSPGTETITIKEKTPPTRYKTLYNEVKVQVTTVEENEEYKVSNVVFTSTDNSGYTLTFDRDTQTINIEAQDELLTGHYNIQLFKYKAGTTEGLGNVAFDINGTTYRTDPDGFIELPVEITETGTETITIKETEPIDGYKAIKGTLEIEATKAIVGNAYDLTSATVKTPINGVDVEFNNLPPLGGTYDGAVIFVNVPNEETVGNYEVKVVKEDKDTGDKLSSVPFEINGVDYSTNDDGIIALGNVRFITTGTDTYTIKEKTAPAGYKQNTEDIVVNVERNLEDDVYYPSVTEVDNDKYKVELDDDEKTIIVTVYNEKIIGDYDLELLKVDNKDETKVLENAIFTLTYGDGSTSQITTTAEGKVELNDIKIEAVGEETLTFEEVEAPAEYDMLEEPIKVKITKSVVGDVYVVTQAELAEPNENATVTLTDGKVQVKVKDQKTILGKYNLEIVKTDEEDNVITDLTTKFEINGENKQTENGKIEYANVAINKNNVSTQDEYSIVETEAPDGYSKFDNEIDVVVTKRLSDDETQYIVDTVQVTEKVSDTETADYTNCEVTTDVDGVTTIKVKVVNYEDLDFSLRKSVTKVTTGDNVKDYSSRLANINAEALDSNESSTAVYEHDKEEIELAKGSIVEFTVRVYNEGHKDGYVTKIQDILPEGLELAPVEEYEENKIWTYNDEKGAYETNDQFVPVLIEAHNDQEDLKYQDVKIITKVKDDCPEDINIVNIAQITEIKHKDGRIGIDRDSRGANFSMPADLSSYEGGEDTNLTDEYIPGQEDDDDFERIVVLDYTKVDIALRKFITAISKDVEFEDEEYLTGDNSRVPVVDKTELDQRKVTTAKYNHTKDAVKVIREDYILYTIRLYNEGNVVGSATKVKDYLPEGVEFVSAEEAPSNRIWTYDEETHSITTNENYEPRLLEAHSKARDLDYQDLTVVCRVLDSVADQTNITNIAEVLEYKFENGEVAEDRDSAIENFVMPEHVEEYNGGEDLDNTDSYIPGQEDDDDFDRIIVDPIFGYYDFEIQKVDELGNAITTLETEYKVNDEEKVSTSGIVKYENVEINRANVATSDVYTIEETKAPKDFTKLDENIRVTITKKKVDNTRYEVDSVTCEVIDKDGTAVANNDLVSLVKDDNGKATIVVKVKNYENLDFTLRKFITAVDEDMDFVESEYLSGNNSREPKVNITALDNGDSTTATYDHTKEPVQVVRNEYILYTIRVYNESTKSGYVKEVKDYVPEGLEFVKDYNINRIWDYDKDTRQLITNDRFEPQLLEGHVTGEALKYFDLQVILKVADDVEEDQIMNNMAEITKIAHSDGTDAIDRDSEVDNFIYPEKPEEYNGGEDLNKEDKYIPGQEDDDDFDKAIVKRAYGYYVVEINKVDQNGSIIKGEATFRVNKLDKKTKDGKVSVDGVVINKDNVSTDDVYVITEVTAPNGYNKLTDTMTLRLTKKLDESRKYYEVEKATLTYKTTDGYTKDMSEGVSIVQDETGKQTISFDVKNTAKPKETPKETPVVNNTTVVIPGPTEQRVVTYSNTSTGKTDPTSKTNTSRVSNISTGDTTSSTRAAATGDLIPVVATYIILGVIVLNAIQIISSKRSKENKK